MSALAEEDFDSLDRSFGRFLAQRSLPEAAELVEQIGAELSRALREGHVCLALDEWDSASGVEAKLTLLRLSGVVASPGGFAPLVLDAGGRLYLHRYFEYEEDLAARLKQRIQPPVPTEDGAAVLSALGAGTEEDWQRMAALVALRSRFCILTGGPGTGKTWTIARILALLLKAEPKLRIALAAPTGRAAARVRESIEAARAQSPGDITIPTEASTIHRLLGTIRGTPRFQFHARNPLPYDLVVVDEASMVDLPLMSKLVQALPAACRLILVGDSDQLASVQAGSVLADLCVRRNAFSPELRGAATAIGIRLPSASSEVGATPLIADCVVELRENHRFDRGGEIQRFCDATRRGATSEALRIATTPGSAVRLVEVAGEGRFGEVLRGFVEERVVPWLAASDPASALRSMLAARLLCAHRRGPRGAERMNARIEEMLMATRRVSRDRSKWYAGRPILISVNDYAHELFNGDAGVLAKSPGDGVIRAFFEAGNGGLKVVHPALLPAHETAFAMSVHKSQGSEYAHVIVVLPEQESPVLSRELIYTAVSRARTSVEIWGTAELLALAIRRPVRRASGLAARLWDAAVSE